MTALTFTKYTSFIVDIANTYRCYVDQEFVSFLLYVNDSAFALLLLKQRGHFLLKFPYFCTGFINKLKDKTNEKSNLQQKTSFNTQKVAILYTRILVYNICVISIRDTVSDGVTKTLVLNIKRVLNTF